MRIVAGIYRGRKLATVRGDIRPTSDRLRESFFNALGGQVIGSTWLDAFAGTGAVGIEALSRGAARVLFNESDPVALRVLERNLQILGIVQGVEVQSADALRLFQGLSAPEADFLFLDPPYRYPQYERLLFEVARSRVCVHRTLILLELFHKTPHHFLPPELEIQRVLNAGDSALLFIRRRQTVSGPEARSS